MGRGRRLSSAPAPFSRLSGLLLDAVCKLRHVIEGLALFLHELRDLLVRVHNRRVVASESLSDLGQGQVGELAAQIHGDLAGFDDVVAALLGTHLFNGDAEVDGTLAHDEADGDLIVVRVGHEVLEHHLREVEVDALLVQRRPRADANESALQLTNVRGDARGHVFEDLRGDLEALGIRLLMEDRDAGLQVRRLNVDEQA